MPDFMQIALQQAALSAEAGEVPVGAVLVNAAGDLLAAAHNLTERQHDPTAHAEILVLRAAAALSQSPRLPDCDLYVSLEPCAMCAAAISFARIRRVYFGAYDPKSGGVEHGPRFFTQSTCHHVPEVVGGVCEAEASAILKDFLRDGVQNKIFVDKKGFCRIQPFIGIFRSDIYDKPY